MHHNKNFSFVKKKNKKQIKKSSHYIINKLLISSKHFVIIQINFEYYF